MSVQVFRDNTVFVNEVFANGRRLFSVFSHALVQVPESIGYMRCKLCRLYSQALAPTRG